MNFLIGLKSKFTMYLYTVKNAINHFRPMKHRYGYDTNTDTHIRLN